MSDCLVSHLPHLRLSKYCDLLPLADLAERAEPLPSQTPLSLLPSLPHNGFPFPLLRIQHTASFVGLAVPHRSHPSDPRHL